MSKKLQTSQVARLLLVNEKTVRNLAERGELGEIEWQDGQWEFGRRIFDADAVEACRQRREQLAVK